MIYKNTDKPAFHLAGFFGKDRGSRSSLYYFFKDFSWWKIVAIFLFLPWVVAFFIMYILLYILINFIRFIVWAIKSAIQAKKASSIQKEKSKNETKEISEGKLFITQNRIFNFNVPIPKSFEVKIDALEDSLISYLQSILNYPLEETIKKIKTIYEVGRIIITVSEIYERKEDYQLIVEVINGNEELKSNLKELRDFAELHKDLISEIINLSKTLV